jgi:hypothetical protein
MPTAKISADEKKWRAQDDLRTLIEAEKIKKDKARLSAAMKESREQILALQKVKENN